MKILIIGANGQLGTDLVSVLRHHPDLSATISEEFGAKAKRPCYSVLENAHLRNLGLDDLSNWREALEQYLKEKGHLK